MSDGFGNSAGPSEDVVASSDKVESDIPSRFLELVRSVGIGRGTEVALDVLFLRWLSLTLENGSRLWEEVLRRAAAKDGGIEAISELVGDLIEPALQSPEFGSGVYPEFMTAVVSLATEIGDGSDPVALVRDSFETVLGGTHRLGKEVGVRETPGTIATLLSRLVVEDGDEVLDPACGIGNALMAAATDHPSTIVEGIEIDSATARQVWMRLRLAGSPADIRLNDAFEEASDLLGRFDAVVLHPPWGRQSYRRDLRPLLQKLPRADELPVQSKQADDFPWILLSLLALNEGGRAAVVLPLSTVFPRHKVWHHYLLDEGALEAIISLPSGGLFSDTSVATAIWLLRRPSTIRRSRPVLLIDAESLVKVTDRKTRVLESAAVDALTDLVSRWRETSETNAPAYVARTVHPADIDMNLGLLPKQYLASPPVEEVTHPQPPSQLITRIDVENFKSFGQKAVLELAPLTLIYGANSAGKSSVIQSVLLLKQSVDQPTLVTQGELIDIGSFGGVVHRHESNRVRLGLQYGTLGSWISLGGVPNPSHLRSIVFEFERSPSGLGVITRESIQFGKNSIELTTTRASESDAFTLPIDTVGEIFDEIARGALLYPFDSGKDRGGTEDDAARRLRNREGKARRSIRRLREAGANSLVVTRRGLLPTSVVELPTVVTSMMTDERALSDVISNTSDLGRLLNGVSEEVRSLLGGVVYLGPIRSAPRRFYDRTGADELSGGGGQTAMFLFDNTTVVAEVNEWFMNLEVPYTLDIVPVGGMEVTNLIGELVALQLTDTRTSVDVTPSDVGFGVSQMLPIVVELLSRRESVVCIEQPETHLHPRLQSRLADLFVHSTRKAGRGNQVIVETHSEHIMLRIQRRIREGAITPDDVSVLYVDQDASGHTEVKKLRLDDDGDFVDEWPHGFFDERFDELFGPE
ncbi:MAG: DUF3696 domain-containing protein [Mycobacteriaceae bacterium]|nr:DUF3696 domain-containing protein [Mycobacteriaceae bacterium]